MDVFINLYCPCNGYDKRGYYDRFNFVVILVPTLVLIDWSVLFSSRREGNGVQGGGWRV